MRLLYFVFVLGVLAANINADDATTIVTTEETSTITTDSITTTPLASNTSSTGTTTPAATQEAVSTGSPIAATTVSRNTAQMTVPTAETAATQAQGSSTPTGAVSSVAGSTKQPTTPAATTLLPVTVSYAAFNYSCVPSAQCVYTFNAPVNSQSFLATEESIITENKGELSNVQTQINQYNKNVSSVFDPENKKVQSLKNKLQAAQEALNWLKVNITIIQANQRDANANLVVLNQYLNGLQANKNTCYYQQCMKPTPPPTTTPTTTKPPTTTPSPCVGFCENTTLADNRVDNKCSVQQGRAFCDCVGNLDGYQQCAFSGCSGESKLPLSATNGLFYSPGYSGNLSGNNIPYPANSTCSWSFNGSYEVNGTDGTVGFTVNLDSTSTLVLDYGTGTRVINSNWRQLNAVLASYTQFKITLKTGSGGEASNHFSWNMYDKT